MTILELVERFPMGTTWAEHPLWKSLPADKQRELASGNTLIAIKPGAGCELEGMPAGRL